MPLIVGEYTYGRPYILWDSPDTKCVVGKFCSIAQNLTVYLGGNHNVNWITTYPFGHINQEIFNKFNGLGHPSSKGDVIIGNDVWIGGNVTIMSGVKIGDGAVIANNSHVVKNVEPYSLVGGNPAKFIKYRFDQQTIDKLLKLQWWNLDIDTINNISPYLCSSDIDGLFEYLDQHNKPEPETIISNSS